LNMLGWHVVLAKTKGIFYKSARLKAYGES
jgi:hypothetical protein